MSGRVALAWRVVRWPYAAGAFAAGLGAGEVAAGVRESVIVEARDDGALGLGEAAPLPGRSRETIADVVRALAALGDRVELGAHGDTRALASVWPTAAAVSSPAARFAVETALLGVFACRVATGIARLVSDAAPRDVPTALVVRDPDEARRAFEAGARCLKVKSGDGERARLAAIAAAAPGATLRLDANRAWPAGEVAARLDALRGLPIDFVEEPCADLVQLAGTRLALPIALDESLADADAATLDALLAWSAVGALVVKPTILGGIARCRELAARVAVPVIVSHALEGPIGTAACAELARALAGDCVRGLVRAAGVGAHPALAGWRIDVPQLRGARVVHARLPGLGFGALDLAGACAAAPVATCATTTTTTTTTTTRSTSSRRRATPAMHPRCGSASA